MAGIFDLLGDSPLKDSVSNENFSQGSQEDSAVRLHLAEAGEGLGEANTAAASVIAICSSIAKCSNALETNQMQRELVDDAIKIDGGLNPREALFLKSALKTLEADFGEGSFSVAALENFGGASARSVQSSVANEALKDQFNKIWVRIQEMLEKLKVAMRDMWRKLFGSFESLKKAAQAADKKFGSLGDTLEKDKVTFTGLEKVAVDGKVDYNAVVKGINGLESKLDGIFKQNSDVVTGYHEAVSAHLEAEIDEAKLAAASAGVAKAIEELGSVAGGSSVTVGEKKYNAVDLMGGQSLMAAVITKADLGADTKTRVTALNNMIKEVSRKVGVVDPKAKLNGEAKDQKPWQQADIIAVGTIVNKIADTLLDQQKQQDAADKSIDALIKAAKKRAGAEVAEDKKELASEISIASTLATKATSLSTVGLQVAQHVAGVARTALSVADKTAACYK